MAGKRQDTVSLLLVQEDHKDTQRNMSQISRAFAQLCPICGGYETDLLDLAIGVNLIAPPVAHPRGRVTTYNSTGAVISDQGMVNGKWQVTLSAAAQVRSIFF